MSYLFDIEDFLGNCRAFGDNILKQIANEVKQNKEIYFQTYGTYDGYKPTQNTLILNSDGSTTIWLYNRDSGGVTNFNIGQMCCEDGYWSLSNLINRCKDSLGLFQDVNITQSYWDADNQTCRWKPLVDGTCSYDAYKIELNPVGDDGALFSLEKNDKSCNLTIDFSYLFKFDCEALSKTLVTPDTDPKLLESKKQKEQQLAELKIKCETLNELLESKKQEFNETPYSIFLSQNGSGGFDGDAATYCINEKNGGLAQLEILLGPLKYLEFIQGSDSFNMTDTQTQNFLILNNESVIKNKLELIYKCNIPYGTKSNLKKEIDEITIQIDECSKQQTSLENELLQINDTASKSVACSTPINVLETFDVSVTLDVVESDGSLTTVSEYELLPTIGEGNLYQYLVDKQDNSGFYFCSLPKPTETWTTGCTSLIAHELTAPDGFVNKDVDLNVSTCNTIKNSLLDDLLFESPFGSSDNDKKAFYATLNKQSFASNWVNFTQFIDDEETINKIINKKIKLSIKINNSCTNVCIYIDNIKLTKECVNGENKKVTISKSPGFELEKIIDNKKSWVNNTTRVDREFHIENINNLTVFRNTNYSVDDERLVINTKEIDLNINIASAIENDVQCFINDNPNLLESVPSNDCGCDLLECYEDVFEIIPYAEAVDTGIIPYQLDPEDLLTTARAVRDAWLKAWNELMLATGPYLDIQNGIYHPNPSEDVMTTYFATRSAWIKALHEFNLASGGGYIEGLTVDQFNTSDERNSYTYNTYAAYEKLAPQMFNTKCGRIFKRNNGDGFLHFVETPTKELKVFISGGDWDYPISTIGKRWIDITSLVQEDYAANWNYEGAYYINYTPEKASYFCKSLMPINYTTWIDMMSFHYQTNGNTSHNQWVNPVENDFFIEWDDKKGKCMTNMFKQVVPEQFSMNYPITSLNFWTNYGSNPLSETPQCTLDVYLRNSATTACTLVDFTWPNVSGDIDAIYRAYRDANLKLINEIKLTERQPQYYIFIIDPATKMLPDETSGYIPVKVTTTIRKGSRDGDIVFKEEYVLNDSSATCSYRDSVGLDKLAVYVGMTDPNSSYWDVNGQDDNFTFTCSIGDAGTLLSGSTSGLPLAGASDNGIDRNWRFDEDYYVHFDVVNNNTNYVYEVTNNDFNLKDKTLPIVCPTSASTQTFDINAALNSINTHKTKMLNNIQEDLDYALNNCTDC